MKLAHIRIKDFRSFSGEHEFDFSSGVNFVVGPNNCGKSNLLRAIELALDPAVVYSPLRDRPTGGDSRLKTRIALTFAVGNTTPEKTLLQRARTYERAVRRAKEGNEGRLATYADDQEVRLVTSFGTDGARLVSFQARGCGAMSMPVDSDEHAKLEQQFRSVVRFAVIHSGQDLESLLQGKFREILQLVLQDHLKDELDQAEIARQQYLHSLQTSLLDPLRRKVQERVGSLYPEITVADMVPDVPAVQTTLSSVDIRLGDAAATTGLTDKGTGLRGAVLLSMLQYLAEQSKRSLVIAVEEPEAFLHPGAQDAIRGHLEELATRPDVSLLVTTHSPYVVSRRGDAMVTELRKGRDGFTAKGGVSRDPHDRMADLLGPLFRDSGMAHVLERALAIPEGTEIVVVTEGYTDGLFIQQVCAATGMADLLEGVHFKPAHSAKKVVLQALLTAAGTTVPVIALLDNDEQGRAAAEHLKKFDWSPSERILMLTAWPGKCTKHPDVEIEDLLPQRATDALVRKLGDHAALDATRKCGNVTHREYSKAWKEAAITELPGLLPSGDAGGIEWLVQEIRSRAQRIRSRDLKAATL